MRSHLLAIFEKKAQIRRPPVPSVSTSGAATNSAAALGGHRPEVHEYLEGRKDAPVHFLGAMVLDRADPDEHTSKSDRSSTPERLTTLKSSSRRSATSCRSTNRGPRERLRNVYHEQGMMRPEVDSSRSGRLSSTEPSSWTWSHPLTHDVEAKHPLRKRKYAITTTLGP